MAMAVAQLLEAMILTTMICRLNKTHLLLYSFFTQTFFQFKSQNKALNVIRQFL